MTFGARILLLNLFSLTVFPATVMAAAPPHVVQFVACYNQIGATGTLTPLPPGIPNVERTLKFETHAPGSADPDNELTFQSDDETSAPAVVSSGATATTAIFTIAVPKSYFDWLLQINTQYHGVFVEYHYDVADSGATTLTSFLVALPNPSLNRCTTPNPNGS